MLRKIQCFKLMRNLVVDLVSVKFDIFKIKVLHGLAISFHLLNTPQLQPLPSTPHRQGRCEPRLDNCEC